MRCTCLAFFVLLFALDGSAKGTDTFRVHADFPTLNKDKKPTQDIYYTADSNFAGSLVIKMLRYRNDTDSTVVLYKKEPRTNFKKGTEKIKFDCSKSDSNTLFNTKFYEILKRANTIAPGFYKTVIDVTDKSSGHIYHSIYFQQVDSPLSANSPLRSDVHKSLAPPSKSFLGLRFRKSQKALESSSAGGSLLNAKSKISKSAKARGLNSEQHSEGKKNYIDYYFQDWFVGRYEVQSKTPTSEHLKSEDNLAETPKYNNSVSGNLTGHPSLYSQSKTIQKDKNDKDEIKGEIAISTNLSTGQEQYSGVDNNFHTVRGQIEIPICNLPVQIEGFYTTQDMNREIKSSYVHVHYDVNELKNKLTQSISSYNNKFNETKSKSLGMTSIYQSSLNALEAKKGQLQHELTSQANPAKLETGNLNTASLSTELKAQAKDTTGLTQGVHSVSDSTKGNDSTTAGTSTTSTEDKLKQDKEKLAKEEADKKRAVEEKQKEIDALDKKIEKYRVLIAQNENTNHFDSLVGYDKTKELTNQSDASYRQMVKKSSNLLPDGEVKKFVTGLSSFDAGMFPKMESKYTMSGQMVKGGDVGYQIGPIETGATVGKTQYIGRDGTLDKYTCYGGRVSVKPIKGHKLSLLYYGYTVDHNMISGDAFFKDAAISAPSFFQPVHIVSGTYDANVSKYLRMEAEAASSFQNSDKMDLPAYSQADKMAYHVEVDGNIANTGVSVIGSYDNTGKGFVNNTLPASLSGTEQYKIAGKSNLFKSLITIGIEYNYLVQNNYASKSSNTKWGVEGKINFKKIPTFSYSYKPFTTFQSYNDTLNIPQRLLFGSVTNAKSTYRIRMHEKSINFSLIYNKSVTTMDTGTYGSEMMQFSTIYSDKIWNGTANIGFIHLTGSNSLTVQTQPDNTKFLSLSGDYKFNKMVSISGGQDFGLATFGFCKYSVNSRVTYRPEKSQMTFRLNFRYTTYQINQGDPWKQIFSGKIDMLYRFKVKSMKNNNF